MYKKIPLFVEVSWTVQGKQTKKEHVIITFLLFLEHFQLFHLSALYESLQDKKVF